MEQDVNEVFVFSSRLHSQLHPVEHTCCDARALKLVLGTVEVVADLPERVRLLLVSLEVTPSAASSPAGPRQKKRLNS